MGRMATSTTLDLGFVLVFLAVGMIGYQELGGMNSVTYYVNVAMILSLACEPKVRRF